MRKKSTTFLVLFLTVLLGLQTTVLFAEDATGIENGQIQVNTVESEPLPEEETADGSVDISENTADEAIPSETDSAQEDAAPQTPAVRQSTLLAAPKEEKIPMSETTIEGIIDKPYNGSPRTHTIKVYYNGEQLVKADCYTVSYSNNTEIGDASVTITGKGMFTGSVTIPFKIVDTVSKKITLSSGTVLEFATAVQEHTLLPDTAQPYWLRLTAKSDKTIYLKWTDCVNKGGDIDGYIVLRRDGSSGNYKEIAKVSSKYCYYTDKKVNANIAYYYVIVGYKKVDSSTLTRSALGLTAEGVRYDSTKKNTYASNSDGLTPIAKMNKSSATVTKGKTLQLSLTYPENAVSTWTRWRTSDSSIAKVDSTGKVTGVSGGTATITARTPAGWDVKCKVTVLTPISEAEVEGITDKTYNGSARTHWVYVYHNGAKLTKGTDYTIEYKNNVNVGTASVIITGIGMYTGTKTINFKIEDTYSKTITFSSGTILNFPKNVREHVLLGDECQPYYLRLTAKDDKSIYLKWTDCVAKNGDIDGYYVLRRDGPTSVTKTYKTIATIPASACSYTDTSVSKDVQYFYVIVGYKDYTEDIVTRSALGLTAEGVRIDSEKTNTYAPDSGLTPYATISSTSCTVYTGTPKTLSLTYPSDCISTWTRWRSSNTAVATVDSTGKVSGLKAGTATITARTPAGWDIKCKVTVKGDPFEAYLVQQGFPKTYWPALKKLHEAHPTWTFVAQKTGMTFDTAVQNEYESGSNYMTTNETNPTRASEKALRYYMDPRNFMTEEYIFQFMDQTETASGTTTTVRRLVSKNSSCFMLDSSVFNLSYLTTAANNAGINANVLAAMIIQEQGWTGGSNSLISGNGGLSIAVYNSSTGKLTKTLNLNGYYNYFNIGAFPASSVPVGTGYYSSGVNASRRGLWYAAGQPNYKGTVTATSYGRPWNTKQKAITGGAQFYKNEYIDNNQKTYYTKKFNVMNGSGRVGDHQYETTIFGARDEGKLLGYAYTSSTKNLRFLIPVYNKIDNETQVTSL